jgi:hypothetical protein
MTPPACVRYTGYGSPAEIIGHAVWLYFRFPLDLRMVEELLAARGIIVSHEANPSPGPCVNPRNPPNASPALRALFVPLEEWVRSGVAPPPSRVPSIAEGTAVEPETVQMRAIAGFAVAPDANRISAPVDWATRRHGSTISMALWSAQSMPMATRWRVLGCRQ